MCGYVGGNRENKGSNQTTTKFCASMADQPSYISNHGSVCEMRSNSFCFQTLKIAINNGKRLLLVEYRLAVRLHEPIITWLLLRLPINSVWEVFWSANINYICMAMYEYYKPPHGGTFV